MAVKTFTDNTSLPASDINAYLNNGGLVYVKQQAVVGSPNSIVVTDAFSAIYDNYRITFAGAQPSATDSFRLMIGSGATADHYSTMQYDLFNGASTGQIRVNNGASIYAVLNEAGNKTAQFSCDILSPFLAQPTVITGESYGRGYYCDFGGTRLASTSFSSFTIICDSAGTMTGGIVTVYGYRKA